MAETTDKTHLKRSLRRIDLVLLFVVAVVNLNVVPSIAANGGATIWLWLLALLFFFLPQGIAVTELARRCPGEGGVYLWTKMFFSDFHGFLSGWCYWTNNVFYVPTVLLYLVGVAFYAGGVKELADNPRVTFPAALFALLALVALNVAGVGIGKWVNNLGGIGTMIIAVAVIGLGTAAFFRHGMAVHLSDFRFLAGDNRIFATFGTMCFGLVGLELASVMGDEIDDPRKDIPPAVTLGGLLTVVLYLGVTLVLLLAVPHQSIGVLQGVVEAVDALAQDIGAHWLVVPLAGTLAVSVAGIASAWLSGSARIPFVAGLDHYLPAALGKLHPKTATPYVALITHGVFSAAFLALSFVKGASVQEAFAIMLALAVVLQLVPFLYMYGALLKLALREPDGAGVYPRPTLFAAGASGLVTTSLGMIVAFLPSRQIGSVWIFEVKMCAGTLFFLGLAAFFFFIYRRREAPSLSAGSTGPKGGNDGGRNAIVTENISALDRR
jgi:amino acid transporter